METTGGLPDCQGDNVCLARATGYLQAVTKQAVTKQADTAAPHGREHGALGAQIPMSAVPRTVADLEVADRGGRGDRAVPWVLARTVESSS